MRTETKRRVTVGLFVIAIILGVLTLLKEYNIL